MRFSLRSNLDEQSVRNVSNIFLNSTNNQVSLECLRILRNCASAGLKDASNLLKATVQKCLNCIVVAFSEKSDQTEEEELLLFRTSLQLIANFINSQPETAGHVWKELEGCIE